MAETPATPAVPDFSNTSLPLAKRYQSAVQHTEDAKRKQAEEETKIKQAAEEAKRKQAADEIVRKAVVAKLMREWFPKFMEEVTTNAAWQAVIKDAFNQKLAQRTLIAYNHEKWFKALNFDVTPEEVQNFMATNTVEFSHLCTKTDHIFKDCKFSIDYNKEKKETSLAVDINPTQTSSCLVM